MNPYTQFQQPYMAPPQKGFPFVSSFLLVALIAVSVLLYISIENGKCGSHPNCAEDSNEFYKLLCYDETPEEGEEEAETIKYKKCSIPKENYFIDSSDNKIKGVTTCDVGKYEDPKGGGEENPNIDTNCTICPGTQPDNGKLICDDDGTNVTIACNYLYKIDDTTCTAEMCVKPENVDPDMVVEKTLSRMGFDVDVKCPTENTWDVRGGCSLDGEDVDATDKDDCIYNTITATRCSEDGGEYVYECP